MTVGSLGRADANVATGMHIESMASNPASVKRGKGQAFELGYLRDPLEAGNNFYVQSADNSSPLGLAGGFSMGYEAGKLSGGGDFSTTDMRLVVGAGARSDVAGVMIGATGRKIGMTLKPKGGKEQELGGWTGDAGLALDLTGGVMLGVTVRNLLEVDGMNLPRRIAGGIGYGSKRFVIEATGSWALNGDQPVYRAGLLVPVGDIAALRAGYIHDSLIDPRTRQSATLGASLMLGRVRLDAAGEMNVGDPSEIRFGFSLVYFMPFAT